MKKELNVDNFKDGDLVLVQNKYCLSKLCEVRVRILSDTKGFMAVKNRADGLALKVIGSQIHTEVDGISDEEIAVGLYGEMWRFYSTKKKRNLI